MSSSDEPAAQTLPADNAAATPAQTLNDQTSQPLAPATEPLTDNPGPAQAVAANISCSTSSSSDSDEETQRRAGDVAKSEPSTHTADTAATTDRLSNLPEISQNSAKNHVPTKSVLSKHNSLLSDVANSSKQLAKKAVRFYASPDHHVSAKPHPPGNTATSPESSIPETAAGGSNSGEAAAAKSDNSAAAPQIYPSPVTEVNEILDGSQIPRGIRSKADRADLITAYTDACKLNGAEPLVPVLDQLKKLVVTKSDGGRSSTNDDNTSDDGESTPNPEHTGRVRRYSFKNSTARKLRQEKFILRGQRLSIENVEPMEEIFRRVQFNKVDVECVDFLDNEGAVALTEILEYYDSAEELQMGYHGGLSVRTWTGLSRMVRRSVSLRSIDVRGCLVPDPALTTWCRAIRGSFNLRVLHLEQTGLSSRPFSLLCVALHWNRTVTDLYLADNDLNANDMKSLAFALKTNRIIGHLDLRNNNLQDSGVRELCYGFNQQLQQFTKPTDEKTEQDLLLNETDAMDKVSMGAQSSVAESEISETGVHTLVLWNNKISGASMAALAQVIKKYDDLMTLNLGQNPKIGDDGVFALRPGLQRAKLQRLGMYNCGLECEGAVAIAEVIAEARDLIRIDLRKNDIRFSGIMALSLAYRSNETLLCLNLDNAKFAIKRNYKRNSMMGMNRGGRNTSSSDDELAGTRIEKSSKGNDSENELAEHQEQFLKDIESYQNRNQEVHKAQKAEEARVKRDRLAEARRRSTEQPKESAGQQVEPLQAVAESGDVETATEVSEETES